MQEFEAVEDMARHLMLAVQICRLTKCFVETAWAPPSAAKMAAVPKKKKIRQKVILAESDTRTVPVTLQAIKNNSSQTLIRTNILDLGIK